MNLLNIPDSSIKKEPLDNNSISPYHLYTSNASPSPQPLSPGCPTLLNNTPIYNHLTTPNIQCSGLNSIFPQFIQTYQQPQQLQHTTSTLQLQQQQQQQQFNQINNPFNMHTKPQHNQQNTLNNLNATATGNIVNNNNNSMNPLGVQSLTNPATTNNVEPANLSSLLDMDSQQFTHINSAELSGLSLSLLDGHYQSEQHQQQQQSQQPPPNQQQDMDQEPDVENMTDSFTRFATDAIKELNDLNNISNRNN